ncbi:hypothetical protein SNE40_014991 [Patella caerulea]|uniref:Tafazzin family protein n=1 Tax=Patella caerulea TaxID=87958 RepID=A0AAN8JJ67_PATCE
MPQNKAWHYLDKKKFPLWWKLSFKIAGFAVAMSTKFFLEWVNKVTVYNREALHNAVANRDKNTGLITLANHYSCLDEPLLWGVLQLKYLIHPDRIRWSLGSHDVCFTNYWHALFFSLGKTIPVVRGNGVYQKSMDFVISKLNNGNWVHLFPEGKVNLEKEKLRLKWGIGRLISESSVTPIVLPIYHIGMDSILPNKTPYIPQIRKKVTYLVGSPMDFTSDIKTLSALKKTPKEKRKYITDKIQEEFFKLRLQAEELHEKAAS